MKNKLLLTSIILAICLTSFSQNEDDFAKYRNEHSRNYQSFKNRAEAEYMSFQDSINKEFVSHIAKAWEEYNAQILLDARKNARLTQAELAERIGADKGYISRIERGITVPTVATLYKIAAAMGLTVELKPI